MAAGDRSQAEELWSKWEQMTALVPQEERAPVEAWIRREREVFPAGMRWKDAGPVEWLEERVGDAPINILHIQGTFGSSAQLRRTEALEEAVETHPNWNLLAQLEGDFQVLPGHDRTTTLDRERQGNPYLREAMVP